MFYMVDNNFDGNNGTNMTLLNNTGDNDFTIKDNNRFKILSIFDFANENIDVKMRYGIHLESIELSIRIGTDYTEYMASGGSDRFIHDMTTSLNIDAKYVDVTSLTEGSDKAKGS
jgi:hypothetical protein